MGAMNMELLLAGTLLHQVIIMFLLVMVGYLLTKAGKITDAGSKTLGNILIYISLPCAIIRGFQVEYTSQTLSHLVTSTILAAVILLLSMIIARLTARGDAIAAFAGAFSNPGFFGIPIITACFAESTVFYIAPFIALLNMCQWTYGVSLLVGEKVSLTPKKILTAPFMVAIIIGLFFLLTGIPLPSLVNQCVGYLAGLNTPLGMFTIGVYMTKVNFFKMFRRTKLYAISLTRLVLVPVCALALLSFLPQYPLEMRLAILIASACPVGSNIAVYADLHNKDYPYSVQTVVISTLLSIVTIPIIVQVAENLWK
jgi:predicted permease